MRQFGSASYFVRYLLLCLFHYSLVQVTFDVVNIVVSFQSIVTLVAPLIVKRSTRVLYRTQFSDQCFPRLIIKIYGNRVM